MNKRKQKLSGNLYRLIYFTSILLLLLTACKKLGSDMQNFGIPAIGFTLYKIKAEQFLHLRNIWFPEAYVKTIDDYWLLFEVTDYGHLCDDSVKYGRTYVLPFAKAAAKYVYYGKDSIDLIPWGERYQQFHDISPRFMVRVYAYRPYIDSVYGLYYEMAPIEYSYHAPSIVFP